MDPGTIVGHPSSQILTDEQKKMDAMNIQKGDMTSFIGMI
jgi:hypothetical protein